MPTIGIRDENEIDKLFDRCARSYGMEYVQAEEALLRLGEKIVVPLRERAQEEIDPFLRVLALMLAGRAESPTDVPQRALEYMDSQEKIAKESIVTVPRSDVLGADLHALFGSQAVVFLAVRMVKQPEWPQWKAASVLEYILIEKEPLTLPPLVRFAVQSDQPDHYRPLVQSVSAVFPEAEVLKAWTEESYYQHRAP